MPRDDASTLDWLLFDQHGVITTAQARRHMSRARLRALLDGKRWRRLSRGLLLSHGGELSPTGRLWAAVLAAGPDAWLAGFAAAREGGLHGRWPRREIIDVIRPGVGGVPRLLKRLPPGLPAVLVHRTVDLPDRDRQVGLPPRTGMARSLLDAARWAPDDRDAVSIIAAGCQQRLVLPAEVREVADRFPHCRRHALVVETLDLAEQGATSPPEIAFVKLCRRHGLPEPQLQVKRRDATGRTRYLDAYFEAYKLHVEIDGAHHMDPRAWAADLARQNDLWVSGDRILRFPAFLVLHKPDEVLRQLTAALRAAGWKKLI
ncbi:MAG: DUF559 domain-containing protein [Hamadaea sp.]|nr:DUF559 domain-containing protein [Hamadaea sp.]